MANWGLLDGLGKGLLMVGENALKRKNLDYEMKIREAYEQGMERLRHSNNMQLVGAENENRVGLLTKEDELARARQDDEQAFTEGQAGEERAFRKDLAELEIQGRMDVLDKQAELGIGDGAGSDTPGNKNLRALYSKTVDQLKAARAVLPGQEDPELIARLEAKVEAYEAALTGGEMEPPAPRDVSEDTNVQSAARAYADDRVSEMAGLFSTDETDFEKFGGSRAEAMRQFEQQYYADARKARKEGLLSSGQDSTARPSANIEAAKERKWGDRQDVENMRANIQSKVKSDADARALLRSPDLIARFDKMRRDNPGFAASDLVLAIRMGPLESAE